MKDIFFVCVLTLTWALVVAPATNQDLDAMFAQIFGKPPTSATFSKDSVTSTTVSPINTDTQTTGAPCTTKDNRNGICVNYYLCDKDNNVIVDGVGLIDIRVSEDACQSYIEVCCSPSDVRNPDDPILPLTDKINMRQGCGWRNPNGVGMETTGDVDHEAKFAEFPSMVAILKSEPLNEDDPNGTRLNVYVGGGSLIHPSVVLTTAHNVADKDGLKARSGEWDTQTTNELYPYQDRDVSLVVVHENYNRKNLFYDIALLFLSEPINMDYPNVGLACLPTIWQRSPAGARCVAAGWGKDKFGREGRYQVILKKVEMPVVDRWQCQKQLRSTRLGHYFMLHSTFMCAGGEVGVDTCKGDGGSPLLCPIEGTEERYIQSGMVAWGIGCGEQDVPGVYVNVAYLRDWVDKEVSAQGLDTSVYVASSLGE